MHVWETGELHTEFWWGNLRENPTSLSVDGTIILKWIFRKWNGSLDWIDLAQDRTGFWLLKMLRQDVHHT